MEDKHWSDEELLALLYGAGRNRDAHLERCGECTERWDAFRERRDSLMRPVSVPEPIVARQKQAIMQRVLESHERRIRAGFPLQSALAGVALSAVMLMAILLHNSESTRQTPLDTAAAAADAKLFTEVMYEASRTEPAALTPVEGLFEKRAQAIRR